MDPLFLIILVALAVVFVYATRRAMRQTLKLPVPKDAAADLKKAAAARQAGQIDPPAVPADVHDARAHLPDNRPDVAEAQPRRDTAPAQPIRSNIDVAWGRSPARPRGPAAAPARPRRDDVRLNRGALPTAAVPGAYRASRGQRMFGSRAKLNQAIIAMTVLGPCRAIAPYTSGGAAEQVPVAER